MGKLFTEMTNEEKIYKIQYNSSYRKQNRDRVLLYDRLKYCRKKISKSNDLIYNTLNMLLLWEMPYYGDSYRAFTECNEFTESLRF